MELISTDDYFILQHLQRSETSLWVCRKTGKFVVRPPWDLADQENPECLGKRLRNREMTVFDI